MNIQQEQKPRYEHDCDECKFLGHYNEADMYFCHQINFPTVIIRYSSIGWDYKSGLKSDDPDLQYVAKIAKEKGLL